MDLPRKEQPSCSHWTPAVSADMDEGGDGRDGRDGAELVSSGVDWGDDEREGESGWGEDWGWGGAP